MNSEVQNELMKQKTFPLWFLFVPIMLLAMLFVTTMLGYDSINRPEENTLRHLVWSGNRTTPPNHDDFRLFKHETPESISTSSSQHVPAHYMQLSYWADIASMDIVVMRAVSVFYYMIACAMTYRMARDIFNEKIGLFALFFVAFSGFHIYYAHEIRMYAMIVTQTIMILWLYWRIMLSSKSSSWYHWILFLFWTIFGLYTHVMISFPLVALGIYHVLVAPKSCKWLGVTLTQMLAGLTFTPWVSSIINGANGANDLTIGNQSAFEVVGSSLFLYSNGFWLGAGFLFLMMLWKYPRKNPHFNYLAFILFMMILVMLIFNELVAFFPFGRMRYTLNILPLFAILWGYGLYIVYQYRRWVAWVIMTFWVVMLFWFNQSDVLLDATELSNVQFTEHYPFHLPFNYLRSNVTDYPKLDDWLVVFHSFVNYSPGRLNYYEYVYERNLETFTTELREYHPERLSKVDNNFPGFWFTYRSVDKASTLAWQESDEISDTFVNFSPCLSPNVHDSIELVYYLDNRIPCDLLSDPDREAILFDNTYVLRDYVIERQDSSLEVSLWWKNLDMVFDNAYGYSLQVFRDGKKVGQTDYPVDNVITHNIVRLEDEIDGDYTVRLIVYSSDDVKSVGGLTDSGIVFERDIELSLRGK